MVECIIYLRPKSSHKFFITLSIFSFIVLVIGNIGFSGKEINSAYAINKTLSVITSVSPITNIVKNVGGDKINLIGIVPEGVNSHTFELVPSDQIKLNNADLVIINGLSLEENMEKTVNEILKKNPKHSIVKTG